MKQIAFLLTFFALLHLTQSQVFFSRSETLSTRLHPSQDVMETLLKTIAPYQLTAVSIASAVGSVRSCWLRFANSSFLSYLEGPIEITSLSGTIDWKMQPHIHIQIANGKGESFGGHLPSLEERGQGKECPIFTTLEIVLLSHRDIIYERRVDPETTFHELYIRTLTQGIMQ
jgi:uncharacterized protein